jgi:glycine/D-amino acid oxidase-like deaminating enzyme
MPDSSGRYDIVILGGGSGGYACALRAAELGKRVALIEKDKVGGTCLHRGCIPTKALLHAAEIADHTNQAGDFGVRARFDGIDMAGVNAYKDKVVDRLWKGLQSTIASRQVEVVYGEGRLLSPTSVGAGGDVYEGGHVVLATGSQPNSLPGLAIDGQRMISSDRALTLDRGARLGGHPGRRRDRRGVRQPVAVVRGRGDDRRDAAPPAAGRGRVELEAAGAGAAAARDLLPGPPSSRPSAATVPRT